MASDKIQIFTDGNFSQTVVKSDKPVLQDDYTYERHVAWITGWLRALATIYIEVVRGTPLLLSTALTVLSGAAAFGTRVDVDLEWPQDRKEAYRGWQPAEPSPIVAMFLARQRGDAAGS